MEPGLSKTLATLQRQLLCRQHRLKSTTTSPGQHAGVRGQPVHTNSCSKRYQVNACWPQDVQHIFQVSILPSTILLRQTRDSVRICFKTRFKWKSIKKQKMLESLSSVRERNTQYLSKFMTRRRHQSVFTVTWGASFTALPTPPHPKWFLFSWAQVCKKLIWSIL